MKEMIYQAQRKVEILFEGEHLDHKFAILNLGTHPTAYVECKIADCHDYGDERLDNIQVHFGFTFFGDAYWNEQDKKKYLGWDYAHYCDYSGYYAKDPVMADMGGKQWTTSEIYNEVKSVIEQLVALENTLNNAG